jgi:hypothetical protein
MSTNDIPRSYHHYHLAAAIARVLSNVTRDEGILGTRGEEEEEEEGKKEDKSHAYVYMPTMDMSRYNN